MGNGGALTLADGDPLALALDAAIAPRSGTTNKLDAHFADRPEALEAIRRNRLRGFSYTQLAEIISTTEDGFTISRAAVEQWLKRQATR